MGHSVAENMRAWQIVQPGDTRHDARKRSVDLGIRVGCKESPYLSLDRGPIVVEGHMREALYRADFCPDVDKQMVRVYGSHTDPMTPQPSRNRGLLIRRRVETLIGLCLREKVVVQRTARIVHVLQELVKGGSARQ